jgi:hypothetical protein
MKPGGFFTKKLYADELQSETKKKEKDPDGSDDSDFGNGPNGGKDAKYNGFCRTD